MTGGPVRFDLQGGESVQEMFRDTPITAYRYLRDYVFASFLSHRRKWLQVKGVKFGRGGRGVKVYKVGERAPTTKKSVHYDLPKDRRAKSTSDAIGKLQKFKAEIRTGSIVLEQLQQGGTVKAKGGKLMAISIKTRPGDPRQWRARHPDARLRFVPRRGGKGIAVLEETGKRKKKLKLRWLLVKRVENKKTLRLYETWDTLKSARDLQWADAVTRMVIDIGKGRG